MWCIELMRPDELCRCLALLFSGCGDGVVTWSWRRGRRSRRRSRRRVGGGHIVRGRTKCGGTRAARTALFNVAGRGGGLTSICGF